MKAWTKEDGTKTHLVNSTSANRANERVTERMASIRQSLSMIEVELQKYESLLCPDWGHAGDLAHVDELLIQAFEFLSETD